MYVRGCDVVRRKIWRAGRSSSHATHTITSSHIHFTYAVFVIDAVLCITKAITSVCKSHFVCVAVVRAEKLLYVFFESFRAN